eukprot:6777248-Pyramimonas_sp.AAC.1
MHVPGRRNRKEIPRASELPIRRVCSTTGKDGSGRSLEGLGRGGASSALFLSTMTANAWPTLIRRKAGGPGDDDRAMKIRDDGNSGKLMDQ